jgi:hypothetical protein
VTSTPKKSVRATTTTWFCRSVVLPQNHGRVCFEGRRHVGPGAQPVYPLPRGGRELRGISLSAGMAAAP